MTDPVHVRTQIRRAAKALLLDLECGHGNVYVGGTWPKGEDKLPCLVIATPSETCLDDTMKPTRQARTVALKIAGRVSGNDDETLLDQLDEMDRQVCDKLMAEVHADSGAFDALVLAVHQTGMVTQIDATTDSRKGTIEISFQLEYATTAGDAATPIVP